MSGGRAPQEGKQETCEANRRRFFPFDLEDGRIEFGPREKSQDDGADAGKKLDPGFVSAEHSRADHRADNKLSDCADDDLGERGGYSKPNRQQAGDQCKAEPQRG